MRNLICHVFGGSAPAEVGEGVVADVAIKVAALLAGLFEADEGFEHQAVDGAGVVAVVSVAEGHNLVAATV